MFSSQYARLSLFNVPSISRLTNNRYSMLISFFLGAEGVLSVMVFGSVSGMTIGLSLRVGDVGVGGRVISGLGGGGGGGDVPRISSSFFYS